MIIYAADDPLVLNGTYDREGYKPGERARIAKAKARQEKGPTTMAKTTKRRASKTDRKLTKPDTKKPRTPRSRALPGLEAVRSTPLDNLCEGIGDCRDSMNAARTEEGQLLVSALQLMQKKNLSIYRHARVELSRVPGAERLRVRVTKEEGDASVETGAEHGAEQEGEPEATGDASDEGDELRPGVHAEH